MTSVACECGCGFEGEDEVTQWCIEEAALIAHDAFQQAALDAEIEASTPTPRPGEITDPAMQEAMRKAKEIHAQQFGAAD